MTANPGGCFKSGWLKAVSRFFLLVLFFSLLYGCAGRNPAAVFYQGKLDQAISSFEKKVAKHDKDYVRHSLNLGSAAFSAGYSKLADKSFQSAVKVMWSAKGSTRGVLSLISAESIKIFKGEPFEKAMASFYIGLIYYQRGEYDNAAASFRKALLADKKSDKKYRNDFAIVHYMLARCYLKSDQEDNARIVLNRARKRFPKNPYFSLTKIKESNFVLIFETGRVPKKYRHGPGASLDGFKRVKTKDFGGAATINGKYLGRGSIAIDLLHQAKTRGASGKDVVQGTKGVLRDAAVVTAVVADNPWVQLGAGLFAVANQSQADIRQWDLLPERVSILSARVPPGTYNLKVDFFDKGGRAISKFAQQWQGIRVPADREKDALYWFRALPGQGGNIVRQRPKQLKQKIVEDKK